MPQLADGVGYCKSYPSLSSTSSAVERRLERERKRRREQQEEAALQDFLSGCPGTAEAEYPFAAGPSQVGLSV